MSAPNTTPPTGQDSDGRESDRFGCWRCRRCGNLLATEKRPEKCRHCRTTDGSDGQHLFEPVEFVQVQVDPSESERTTRERAFNHFTRYGVNDRTAGELAKELGTTTGYVRALRSEYRREQEAGSQ
jgi:hypothetical protein